MTTTVLSTLQQNLPTLVFDTPAALGAYLAAELLAEINAARAAGRPYLLGCPGGRSLRSTYQALGGQAGIIQADLSGLVIVMMDDYVLPTTEGFIHCPAETHYSCRRFARHEIRTVLNRELPPARQLPAANLWFPNPADPAAYDQQLAQAGGIDCFLLASGASDGHVAFNPPGTPLSAGTRIIPLAESTRRDNLSTFPEFDNLDQMPRHGVSVGPQTIIHLSRRAVLVIHGAHKGIAVRRLAGYADYSSDWPVSLIYRCREPQLLVDRAALGQAG